MEINNVFSPVPFYKNKKYWHSNKWYTYGQKCPIMMTSQNTLPFQLVVGSGVTLSSFTIKKANSDTTVCTVSTSGNYASIPGESYNVIQVKACAISALPYGNYYYALTLSDGSTYISDIIAIISDMSKCIKITYKNVENLYFSSGHIDFSNAFVFELYLPTTIGKPEYEYEEELTKRLGYKFLESQVVNKVYKFTFLATEQMCDAYRFVRMCDYIRIDTYNPDLSEYDHYNVIYLSSEVDWLDNGDIASIETSFETDSIVQKLQDYSRTQLVNFYNALLSNSDEVLKFDEETIAQYYNNYLQSIDGKMIRQLDETGAISDNTVIAIDENNGTAAAKKILLKPLIVSEVKNNIRDFIVNLDEKYLRKDRNERTEHALSIGGNLSIDGITYINNQLRTLDAVLSMLTGRGTIIKDGLIQTDRLEVRGSMTVMDLIINELQGMAADFLFSDVGKVTEVYGDGSSTADNPTYVLTIDKRTDIDITTISEGDIIQQVVNTLPTGGVSYYSSWLRVLSVNQAANAITAVLYPDTQVPGGKNYPPAAGYNIARRGNAIMPDTADETNERSQYWMLSSREGRIQFLQNVFKPLLEDYNYALTLGKLPDLKALEKLPVSTEDIGLVAKTAIIERSYRFDYNGDVVPEKVDRGEWSAEVAASDAPYRNVKHEYTNETGYQYSLLEQHTVWHMGCRWGCLTDKTLAEPRWNSADWVMLEGYDELSMRFASSNGNSFHAGHVDTEVTPSVYLGNIDISDDIAASDWAWTYKLGSYAGRVLHITSELMPADWSATKPARFVCTAYVRVGENQVQEVQNEVII